MNSPSPVQWSDIDTVLLDMDGTLLDLHFDNHFWQGHVPLRYAERHGIEEAVAREKLAPLFEETRGSLDWYCLDFWSRNLDLDIVALKREVSDRIGILPGVTRFLDRVRASGREVWLVTNAHPDSVQLKMEHTGIEGHFDRRINAHELGFPKENDRFWQTLQARQPFDPARSLFVDDSLPVLEAARRFGIARVIAIRCPDSTQPAREVPDFDAVDAVADLWPVTGG